MSALHHISDALKRLPAVREGWDRAILVGISAERSIMSALSSEDRKKGLPEKINGVLVISTLEFDGWEIRDIDPKGKWHDAEAVA